MISREVRFHNSRGKPPSLNVHNTCRIGVELGDGDNMYVRIGGYALHENYITKNNNLTRSRAM